MVISNFNAAEPCRFSTWLPRPFWIGVAAVGLIILAIGLGIGVPMYRQHSAILEIQRLGGFVETNFGGPNWLRDLVGERWMQVFDEPSYIQFGEQSADDTVAR